MNLIRTLCLALLALTPGCGWYYLDPDPKQIPLGAETPGFELPDRYGKPVSLEALVADDHNVTLVFYRGHW